MTINEILSMFNFDNIVKLFGNITIGQKQDTTSQLIGMFASVAAIAASFVK